MEDLISLKNTDYTYSPDTPLSFHAMKNVSITVKKGEILGIIGVTGSGKSTLLKVLSGQFTKISGERYFHESISKNSLVPDRGRIGLVFQYPEDQLFEETIYEDVSFGPRQLGKSPELTEKLVYDSLKFMGVDIEDIKTRSPFDLSGGQKRKVAIAGILALDPEIIILDEPTSGLDPMSKWRFLDTLKRLNKAGKTIILVSHDLEALASVVERVAVIDNGNLVMEGKTEEIFSRVEELIDLNIGAYVINWFFYELNKNGFKFNERILDFKNFEKEINSVFRKDGE